MRLADVLPGDQDTLAGQVLVSRKPQMANVEIGDQEAEGVRGLGLRDVVAERTAVAAHQGFAALAGHPAVSWWGGVICHVDASDRAGDERGFLPGSDGPGRMPPRPPTDDPRHHSAVLL